MKFKNKSV